MPIQLLVLCAVMLTDTTFFDDVLLNAEIIEKFCLYI